MTVALNVPDAGSRAVVAESLVALTVTVFAALTQPEKETSATTEPFGTPTDTVSPTTAPVTVIVRSAKLLAAIEGKSSVAVAERMFATMVPPPTRNVPLAVKLVSCKEPRALLPPDPI